MSRFWKLSAIVALAFLTLAPAALAEERGEAAEHSGGSRSYSYGYYPGFYGLGWWYDPWYSPWGGPSYVTPPTTGNVKIVSKHEGDGIYVDGGYAGQTGKLKKFSLHPGKHTIELRDSRGHTLYQESVYVIAGKTVKIRADYLG